MIFSRFERTVAFRYLRPRGQGFISVIAGFSFLGIMLGVATLIIVMAVMNGFRHEIFQKILGINGHILVHKMHGEPFDDFAEATARLSVVPGIKAVLPLIEGQAMISSDVNTLGAVVRGMTEAGIKQLPLLAKPEAIKDGTFDEAWQKSALRNLAVKRWGKPEEIGDAAVFLASNKAGYITGQSISVSGGYGL